MSAVEDLRALIAAAPGAGVVAFGASTSPAVLDYDGLAWGPEGQAQLGVEMLTLTYVYPDLPGLVPGSAITFTNDEGVASSYIVSRGPRRRGDGLEGVVILEEA